MDALEELINAGPEPSYRVKRVVLLRYEDILNARQLMRKWVDITVALGFEAGQWRRIAASFRRVDLGVKTGQLKPPSSAAKARPVSPVNRSATGNKGNNGLIGPSSGPDDENLDPETLMSRYAINRSKS